MTGILPKQQAHIKNSLEARCLPLGIDDVEEWLVSNCIDTLTFDSAYELQNYIAVLPVTRPESQAHLPLSASAIVVNKKKAPCQICLKLVNSGLGLHVFDGSWATYHESADCELVGELPPLNWDTDNLKSSLEYFVSTLDKVPTVLVPSAELLALSQATDAELQFELSLPLLPFQRAGVRYALDTKRVLICDAMGLGKTCQGIAIAVDTAMNKKRTLIVVPPHLRLQWVKEFKKFAPHLKVTTVSGRKPHAVAKSDVVIIGDSVVEAWSLRLVGLFDTLIVDEAHSIKNEKAGRTKGVAYIARSIPQDGIIALMSGTLTPNRPSELISPLKIINRLDNLFVSRKQFLIRYCNYQIINGYPNTGGATNTVELNQMLRGSCMVRRKKEDVLKDLPIKRRAQVDIEISGTDMALYRKAEDDFLAWVFAEFGQDAWLRASKAEVLTKMNKLRQMLGVAKIKAVVEHAESLLAEDEQVVIFAYHKAVIAGLETALQKHGVVVVAGGSTSEEKQESVDKFMAGKAKVFIGQFQSAGSGLNLTCASHVILAEMCWSPSDGQQAEDRCHRIGAKNPVVAWWITAVDLNKPTMDMRLWSLLNSKAEVTSAVLDGWGTGLDANVGSVSAQLLKDMMSEY